MERSAINPGARQRKGSGVRVTFSFVCSALVVFLTVPPARGQQTNRGTKREALPNYAAEQTSLRARFAQANREYRASLETLAALYEADATRSHVRLEKMKELYAQGLITRQEIQPAEDAESVARDKFARVQAELKSVDLQLAEAMVEVETEETATKLNASPPPRSVSGVLHATAYIRYSGERSWSLSEVGAIKEFFVQRFGRALPIHVFGQSPLHDRWGYDHRNAMDIGLNPNSSEGRALMAYLRANGIPFTGFHFAIPGIATGPHIHVGLPSHRIGSAWPAVTAGNL